MVMEFDKKLYAKKTQFIARCMNTECSKCGKWDGKHCTDSTHPEGRLLKKGLRARTKSYKTLVRMFDDACTDACTKEDLVYCMDGATDRIYSLLDSMDCKSGIGKISRRVSGIRETLGLVEKICKRL